MEIMTFKKFVKYYLLGESVKEIELNRILDKVSKKSNLDEREKRFLDLYNSTKEDDMIDMLYLSRMDVFSKIKNLLNKGVNVVCDLSDRNGKFGLKITNIENDYENDVCIVEMGREECLLQDKFLYNLIYNGKKMEYSLQIQDEYYEKIFKEK